MRFILISSILLICLVWSNSSIGKTQNAKDIEPISTTQKLEVSDFVVYSQVLENIVYWDNNPDSKAPFSSVKGDWLTIKKETIVLENLEHLTQIPNLPNDLLNDFTKKNKSKENLRSGFDVKIAHNVVGQKGSLEQFFTAQKNKNPRLAAIIGLSRIGFSKDNSQSLVYIEYYNPQFGLQKKYCLISWAKDGEGLIDKSINWF